jgi:hypothetical protein
MLRAWLRRWLGIDVLIPEGAQVFVVCHKGEPLRVCRTQADVRDALEELPIPSRVFQVPVR